MTIHICLSLVRNPSHRPKKISWDWQPQHPSKLPRKTSPVSVTTLPDEGHPVIQERNDNFRCLKKTCVSCNHKEWGIEEQHITFLLNGNKSHPKHGKNPTFLDIPQRSGILLPKTCLLQTYVNHVSLHPPKVALMTTNQPCLPEPPVNVPIWRNGGMMTIP